MEDEFSLALCICFIVYSCSSRDTHQTCKSLSSYLAISSSFSCVRSAYSWNSNEIRMSEVANVFVFDWSEPFWQKQFGSAKWRPLHFVTEMCRLSSQLCSACFPLQLGKHSLQCKSYWWRSGELCVYCCSQRAQQHLDKFCMLRAKVGGVYHIVYKSVIGRACQTSALGGAAWKSPTRQQLDKPAWVDITTTTRLSAA